MGEVSFSIETLENILKRQSALTEQLCDPDLQKDPARRIQMEKEWADQEKILTPYRRYQETLKQIQDCDLLRKDETVEPELREWAHQEWIAGQDQKVSLENVLRSLLFPKNPLDDKNSILEIRAGTGGNEAALFAADLMRMYTKFSEKKKLRVETISVNEIGIGGLKEAIVSISGENVYRHLKYESGVHRVQRVPETEASGRVHTSTVTVAVLPEAEEVDIQIDPKTLKIDTFCSSGAGGQSVNTTYSAVRITHIPSGLVVSCQDERSQLKNKEKGMRVLRSRLLAMEREKQESERAQDRKSQVGTGERSEKIRTYNFKENRVTDHRLNRSFYQLVDILEGNIEELTDALLAWDLEKRISGDNS